MKRSYTLLLAIAFMLALSACKKSETQQRLTLGNWMRLQTNTYGVTAVVEDVHFNDNGDMIQRMYLKHMLENKILGFYTKRLAKYRENNGMLELTDIREYGDYTGPEGYRDEKDLSLKQGILTEASIPFSVTDNASVLTLGYLCPPNALCAQSYLVFNKVR